jgi:DNA-binding response OmpR family regulator
MNRHREGPAGRRVLVVDDLDQMRTLICRALSPLGYQVDLAATLAEARGLGPAGYDAVLIDAKLGAERGMDLIEALQSEDPAAARRCLVMTGGAVDQIPDGVACLAKPFQVADLLDAIQALDRPDVIPDPQRSADSTAHAAAQPAGQSAGHPAGNSVSAAQDGPGNWRLLALTRRTRARERQELVDFLHDGPIQELTAATLELQMVSRSLRPGQIPRFDAVLRQLTAASGSLRWLIDGNWPFLVPETHLDTSLQQRTAWLLAEPVTVHIDEHQLALGAAEVPIIADVAELMLLAMVSAAPPSRADITVRAPGQVIEIELAVTATIGDDHALGDPAVVQAALDDVAAAVRASVHTTLHGHPWHARLVLARQPAAQSSVGVASR